MSAGHQGVMVDALTFTMKSATKEGVRSAVVTAQQRKGNLEQQPNLPTSSKHYNFAKNILFISRRRMEWLEWLEEQILRYLSPSIHVSRIQLLQRPIRKIQALVFSGIAGLAGTYGRHTLLLIWGKYCVHISLLNMMIEFRFHHLDIPIEVYLSKSYFAHKRETFSNTWTRCEAIKPPAGKTNKRKKQTHEKQNTQTSFYACTWFELRAMFATRLCRVPGWFRVKIQIHHQKPCISVSWTYTFRAPLFITDVP